MCRLWEKEIEGRNDTNILISKVSNKKKLKIA